jgi:pyridoxamine 5'-phosphate oxidase
MTTNDFLPEPLPPDPMPIFRAWLDEAIERADQPNPNSMAVATVDAEGRPSVRIVLVKELVPSPGYLVFYTNYRSRKGRELEARPYASGVLHWDHRHRQVRVSGPVLRSPDEESDEYFATRPLASRIGAWASQQSEPLASRATLADQVNAVRERFAIGPQAPDAQIPRPPHWGGFRLWIDRLELWVEGPGRVHDRAVWTRDLTRYDAASFDAGAWSATRLNP